MYKFVVIYIICISRCLYKSDLRVYTTICLTKFFLWTKRRQISFFIEFGKHHVYNECIWCEMDILNIYAMPDIGTIWYSTKRTWLQDSGKVFLDALFARVCRLFASIYIHAFMLRLLYISYQIFFYKFAWSACGKRAAAPSPQVHSYTKW